MAENAEIKVKSIKKTVDVLNCFLTKQPLGVTEISERLGLYKSNVHSILSTLTALEYLDQDPVSGKYYLGIGVLRLGRAIGNRYSFHALASPHMQALSDETGEIVYLTVPFQNHKVYYLDTAFPTTGVPHLVGSVQNIIENMNCTSSGKAMLAFMPESYIEEVLAEPLPAATEYTITDPDELRRALAEVRRRGYATDNMEAEIGISCVAVPILSAGGVVGAMSVSGPSPRFTSERIPELAEKLKRHVYELQREL